MLTFDLETTNRTKGSALDATNNVVMVAWSEDDEREVHTHYGGLMEATEFWKAWDRHDVVLCHNAKFEMHWMKRFGVDIHTRKWHDTMLAERVIAGNRQWKLSLDAVAQRYGQDAKDPVIDTMMKAGVCPSDMPVRRLTARNVRDVRVTKAIFDRQLEILKSCDLLHLYRTRCDLAAVLCDMEAHGMYLDKTRVLETYHHAAEKIVGVERKLNKLTGGINLRSPDQLAHYLYGELKFPEKKGANGKPLRNKPSKQFPNGRPKTDQHTLMWLSKVAETDEQKTFLELRKEYGSLNAELSKNLEFFKGVVDEGNEHFHSQFNQTVAATHRLTASGVPLQFEQFDKPKSVQLQNSPRKFKKLYRAPTMGGNWHVVEVDSSQLEFRVAAFVGNDKQARLDIADPDFDAHCKSASVMNEISYETFLSSYREGYGAYKNLRQEAKSDTFKPLYGGTKGTPAQERWYKEFNERYSDLHKAQEDWVAEVAITGELHTPWGMRFYWNCQYNRRGVLIDTITHRPVGPQIYNYPVQSLATAEMMPIAIILLHKKMREAGMHAMLVNTVHDSVIAYVPEHELEKFKALAKDAFTIDLRNHLRIHYNIEFDVPLGCGITVGKHWGEGDEETYDEVES